MLDQRDERGAAAQQPPDHCIACGRIRGLAVAYRRHRMT